jgi:two-component system chemotaxis response regulator CheY
MSENPFAKYRILIVDDNMMMRRLIISQLTSLGFQVIEKASSASEALSHLEGNIATGTPFSIVLLDWNMPEMSGLDFLKVCRSQKQFDNTAIVMLTAESEQRNVVAALKSGATSYITKPLTLDTLVGKMKQIIVWVENEATKTKAGAAHG